MSPCWNRTALKLRKWHLFAIWLNSTLKAFMSKVQVLPDMSLWKFKRQQNVLGQQCNLWELQQRQASVHCLLFTVPHAAVLLAVEKLHCDLPPQILLTACIVYQCLWQIRCHTYAMTGLNGQWGHCQLRCYMQAWAENHNLPLLHKA